MEEEDKSGEEDVPYQERPRGDQEGSYFPVKGRLSQDIDGETEDEVSRGSSDETSWRRLEDNSRHLS